MQDELDQITDAELSECFAREVAGWKFYPPPSKFRWDNENGTPTVYEPEFATSADAVLPFLGKYSSFVSAEICGQNWLVFISKYDFTRDSGLAPTFARAACIALIRAKRSAGK